VFFLTLGDVRVSSKRGRFEHEAKAIPEFVVPEIEVSDLLMMVIIVAVVRMLSFQMQLTILLLILLLQA
jgi:hypothetical protein